MKHTFTIENAYNFAWEKMKKYWASMLALGIITFGINMLFSIPMAIIQATMTSVSDVNLDRYGYPEASMTGLGLGLYSVFYVASTLVSIWLGYNIYKIILKIIDNKDFKIGEIFKSDSKTLSGVGAYFLASLVYGLVVFVGLIALVIPGIYLAIKYFFAPYLILDKGMRIGAAFDKSADMTKGNMLKMIGFALVSFAIVIVGLLALIVGVIPAMILTTFAGFYIYRKLADGHVNGEHGHKAEEVKEV
jgi:uncharacterized membrane protein